MSSGPSLPRRDLVFTSTDEDGDRRPAARRRFETHGAYLRAFALMCCDPDGTRDRPPRLVEQLLPDLARRVQDQAPLPAHREPPALAQVRASLINGWGTEMLLAQSGLLPKSSSGLGFLVNQWAVVQAYYAGYHAVQALIVARGSARPTSHPATQKGFASVWADRNVDLAPWSLGVGARGWRNGGARPVDDSVDPQLGARHDNKWDVAYKALRTTREKAYPAAEARARKDLKAEQRKRWGEEQRDRVAAGKREQKRPTWWNTRGKLEADERQRARDGVRTYTLLDYLYRLRIGSNYDDASMFVEGPANAVAAGQFNRDLILVTSATMLVHEIQITRLVGRPQMKRWVDDWLWSTGGTTGGLRTRREVLSRN